MGLLMYGFIYLLTIALILDNRFIPSRLFPLIWFAVMFCLSLSIRWPLISSGQFTYVGDLTAYVINFTSGVSFITYHLREPVFFIGSQYLYNIVGNPGLVFIISDSILFATFYKSVGLFQSFFSKPIIFNNIKYLYFAAILTYPFISGMHNHYRQILAVAIAMCALGLAEKKPMKAFFIFLISALTHNATLLLAPILLILHKRNLTFNLWLMGFFAVIFILFPPSDFFISEVFRRFSETEVRETIAARAEIYLYLILFCTFFVILLEYFYKRKVQAKFIMLIMLLTLVYFVSFLLFANQPASRVFMMVLTILFLLIGFYIEVRFKTGSIERLIYFHISLVPLLGLRGDGLVYEFGL